MELYTGEPKPYSQPLVASIHSPLTKQIIKSQQESVRCVLDINRNSDPYLSLREIGVQALGDEMNFYGWLISPIGALNLDDIRSNSIQGVVSNLIRINNNDTAVKPIDCIFDQGGYTMIYHMLGRMAHGIYS